MESALPPNPHPGVRDAEFQLWETHWTRCNEQLGNYETLVRYAEETKDVDLMLRSAWKLKVTFSLSYVLVLCCCCCD